MSFLWQNLLVLAQGRAGYHGSLRHADAVLPGSAGVLSATLTQPGALAGQSGGWEVALAVVNDQSCWVWELSQGFVCGLFLDYRVYAAGGMGLDLRPHNHLQHYDMLKDMWVSLAPMPTPRYAATSFLRGSKIYVLGKGGSHLCVYLPASGINTGVGEDVG